MHPKQAVTMVVKQQLLHLPWYASPVGGCANQTTLYVPMYGNLTSVRAHDPDHIIGGRDVKKKHTARRIADNLVSLVLRTGLSLYYLNQTYILRDLESSLRRSYAVVMHWLCFPRFWIIEVSKFCTRKFTMFFSYAVGAIIIRIFCCKNTGYYMSWIWR